MKFIGDDDADRLRQSRGLIKACVDIALRLPAQIRQGDDRACAASDIRFGRPVENAQESLSPSPSVARLTGLSG